MPDQGQNHTAKSFSSVWVFLWLQAPAQKPGECLAAKYSTVSSGPYSTLQITLFQNQGVSSPMKLANAKKLHRKCNFSVLCAFLFVCNLPLSPDSCFLSGTFIAFYQNWILSAFLVLQAQKQALLLWPAFTKHYYKSVQASFSAPLWHISILSSMGGFLIFSVLPALQLSKSNPSSPLLQLNECLLLFISGFVPHLMFRHCFFSHSFALFLCQA